MFIYYYLNKYFYNDIIIEYLLRYDESGFSFEEHEL